MGGRGAAATSDNVEHPAFRQPADHASHDLGTVIVPAEFIGYTGIGIETYGVVAESCYLGDQRGHHFSAKGAVDTESAERRRVLDGAIESLKCLAGECPAAPVRHRRGNDERQGIAEQVQRVNRRLGIERIETGLKKDDVSASADQSIYLLTVCIDEIVEVVRPIRRIGRVRSEREGFPGRADASCNIDLAAGAVGYAARPSGRLVCLLCSLTHQTFVGKRYPVGIEAVGRNDVRSGVYVRT